MALSLLIVDDSALMRRQLKKIFAEAGDIEILTARDGEDALEKLDIWHIDVVTLDINMPVMDGLTCLSHIMSRYPMPVVMVSSLTDKGALATFEALEMGAFDYVTKPGGTVSLNLEQVADELVKKVRAAYRSRRNFSKQVQKLGASTTPTQQPAKAVRRSTAHQQTPTKKLASADSEPGLVLVGVSTGGPGTLELLTRQLPGDFPWPILVAQHMPARFTKVFANRLDGILSLNVKEVASPTPLQPGSLYIAQGDADVRLVRRAGKLRAVSQPLSKNHLWHPSVALMVASALEVCDAEKIICVQLTGMGDDGAREMAQAFHQGARVIAESEDSAVVYGMPRALQELCPEATSLAADQIAQQLLDWVTE